MTQRCEWEQARLLLEHALPARRAPGDFAARQNRNLRRLVSYAAQYSPYYAALFRDAGVSPAEVRTTADLARLPVLSTDVIRERAAELRTSEMDAARFLPRLTTGTTGRRRCIWTTPMEHILGTLRHVRGYERCGLRFWHRQAKFGVPGCIPNKPWQLQRLGIYRRGYVPIGESPEKKVAWLRQFRPDALMSWASALDEIALYLEREDQKLHIPMVFSSSDMLWPDARRRIEQRLQARVVDWYGAAETGPVAWECSAGAMHMADDLVVLELLDDADQPALAGRVVCTPLWRFGLPLIRCELGDYAEWLDGSCPCGSSWPAIRNLRGRELDLLAPTADGHRRVPMPVLAVAFEAPGVRQYQLVQETSDRYILRLVTGPEFTPEAERTVAERFRSAFGGGLGVRIVKTASLPQPPGMKFTPVVTLERLQRIQAAGGDTRVFFDAHGRIARRPERVMEEHARTTHEKMYSRNQWKAPASVRPTRDVLEVYDRWIGDAARRQDASMLILGSTPELRDLAIVHGIVPVACDHSRRIWESMGELMTRKGPEEFLEANWLEIPEDRAYDVIAGDGSLVMLPLEKLEPMLAKIAALLKPTGVALLKVGVRPRPFTVDDFANAVAEHRRTKPPMSLYDYTFILVTEVRSSSYADWTHRKLWEDVLSKHLTEEEFAPIRPQLIDAKFFTPTKTDFDAMVNRHLAVEQVVVAKGLGQWGTAQLYVLRPRKDDR